MNNYPNTGVGLKKMFIAAIGAIICTVLAFIPIINILAAVGAIVFAVLSMVGLYGVGQDIEGCKTAFTLTIVNIVLSVLSTFLGEVFIFGTLIDVASTVVSLLVIYYVCKSVGDALKEIGAADVAEKGETVWKINLVCSAISVVVSVLALIPIIQIIAAVIAVVVAIVSVVASILYMIFLYQSSQKFGA